MQPDRHKVPTIGENPNGIWMGHLKDAIGLLGPVRPILA